MITSKATFPYRLARAVWGWRPSNASPRLSIVLVATMTLVSTSAAVAATADLENHAPRNKSGWQQLAQQKSGEPDAVPSDPNFTTATYGDWVLRCDRTNKTSAKICDVAHTVQGQDQQGAAVAQLSIAKVAGGWRIYGLLPTNIQLPSTVTLKAADDSPNLEFNWRRCLPNGCVSEAEPSQSEFDRWRKLSGDGQLLYKDATGTEVAVPISLRGLSQAVNALDKEQR